MAGLSVCGSPHSRPGQARFRGEPFQEIAPRVVDVQARGRHQPILEHRGLAWNVDDVEDFGRDGACGVLFRTLDVHALDEVRDVLEVPELGTARRLHEQQLSETAQEFAQHVDGALAQDERTSARRGHVGHRALFLAPAAAVGVLDDGRRLPVQALAIDVELVDVLDRRDDLNRPIKCPPSVV